MVVSTSLPDCQRYPCKAQHLPRVSGSALCRSTSERAIGEWGKSGLCWYGMAVHIRTCTMCGPVRLVMGVRRWALVVLLAYGAGRDTTYVLGNGCSRFHLLPSYLDLCVHSPAVPPGQLGQTPSFIHLLSSFYLLASFFPLTPLPPHSLTSPHPLILCPTLSPSLPPTHFYSPTDPPSNPSTLPHSLISTDPSIQPSNSPSLTHSLISTHPLILHPILPHSLISTHPLILHPILPHSLTHSLTHSFLLTH